MKKWYDFGAFGNTIIELSWLDIGKLILGYELDPGSCVKLSLGKSRRKALFEAEPRESQLAKYKTL